MGIFDWFSTTVPEPQVPKPREEPLLQLLDFLASERGVELGTRIAFVAAAFFPPAVVFRMAPEKLQALAKLAAWYLRSGLSSGELLSDGKGGFISKAWAEDKRHHLNLDGTFRY